MKVIVAGTRHVWTHADIYNYLDTTYPFGLFDELVSGMCPDSPDVFAVHWAELCNREQENSIQIHKFPADWVKYERAAGFRRNEQMADFADALIAFWDGKSHGTEHMIDCMFERKKPVHVVFPK